MIMTEGKFVEHYNAYENMLMVLETAAQKLGLQPQNRITAENAVSIKAQGVFP